MEHSDRQIGTAKAAADEIARLRARLGELEAEKAWTNGQHELWIEEREALVREVRRLRGASASRVLKAQQPGVLVAMPYLTMGGAQAIVSQICRQLRDLGYRLLVLTTEPAAAGEGDSSDWFRDSVEAIYDLPQLPDHKTPWPELISSLLERERVSVIWQIGASYLYPLLPQIRRRFPEIGVVDLLFCTYGHAESHVSYCRCFDHAVVEHAGTRDWLLAQGIPQEKISIVPNGVDLDRYSPRPRLDWRTRGPRTEGDPRFVVGFFGRLCEDKGADIFLDIASELRSPNVEFLLCGVGPLDAELQEKARQGGFAGRVHFLGFVSTPDYLPCCDAVVVSSRLDSRPNVVMESLAMGIPVVASRVGSIPAMLPKEHEDLLCEAGDLPAFVAAVRRLAEGAPRPRERSVSARLHAEEHFSIAEMGKAYARLFDAVRARRQRFRRLRRGVGAVAGLLHAAGHLAPPVKSHLKNAFLVFRLRRSGAWAEVVREFDREYYIRTNPGARLWKPLALLHYVFWGFRRSFDPSPGFRTRDYLNFHPDVEKSGFNPLLHYIAFGRAERRRLGPIRMSGSAGRRLGGL